MAQRIANQRAQREIPHLSPSAPAPLGTPRFAGRERTILRCRLACLALCFAAPVATIAADVPCAVGTRVSGEFGGGEQGTIAEIGSQPPHVGAYRITFSWSPRGEWYHPNTWKVHLAGSGDRCVVAAAALPTPPAGTPPDAPTGSGPAPASAGLPGGRCQTGAAVIDRQQRQGRVVGEENGMCKVKLADGETRSYLPWMLSSPDGAGAAQGLAPGSYTCSASGAGFFRIEIRDDDSYSSSSGNVGHYTLDAATAKIGFTSGSLAAYHAKLLGPGKFGLSGDSSTRFHTVCNLKK